jgi:glycosyltransferase involved in cell wall biosynthesis
MKILHITNSIDKSAGGPARSIPQTCVELSKLGVLIELVTQDSANKVAISDTAHLSIKYMSIGELFLYGSRLSAKDINLIHLQHIWNPYIQVMAFWAYQKNIPYIITPRGMLEPWIMAQSPYKKKLGFLLYQRKAIQRAAYLHATAQMEALNIKALGFLNPIAIIPNGIDLSKVKKIKTVYGTKKMVFLSRMHPKKGIELLLEAWRVIDTQDWSLEIAGNGADSYNAELSQSAHDLQNVSFVGPKYGEEKWDFLRSADVMVLPTYSENFGIVVAEALAVGVPVITSQGTPWEDLESFQCGWWINLSPTQLETCLLKAINTPIQQLNIMGSNGRKLIEEKYNIQAVAINLSELYKKIVN